MGITKEGAVSEEEITGAILSNSHGQICVQVQRFSTDPALSASELKTSLGERRNWGGWEIQKFKNYFCGGEEEAPNYRAFSLWKRA